jgi:hypothetical protein
MKLKILKQFIKIIKQQDKDFFIEDIYNSKDITKEDIIKILLEEDNSNSNKNIVVKYVIDLKYTIESKLFKQILNYLSFSYKEEQDKNIGDAICILLEYGASNINQLKLQSLKTLLENIKDDKTKKIFFENYTETLFLQKNDDDFNLYLLKEYFTHNVDNKNYKNYIDYIFSTTQYDTFIKAIIDNICDSDNKELVKYVITKCLEKNKF